MLWLRAYSKRLDPAPPPKQIDATAVSTTSHENDVLNASVGVDLEVAPPVAGTSSAVQSASASDLEVEMNAASATLDQPDAEQLVTFGPGPIGMGLRDDSGKVVVSSVDEGGAAEAQGVSVGCIIREVNGASAQGMDMLSVVAIIKTAPRPLSMKVARVEADLFL